MSLSNILLTNGYDLKAKSIALQTTGGTPANLNYYENFTVVANWSGAISSSSQISVSRIGNTCIVSTFGFSAAASATAFITSSGILPARFRPINNLFFTIPGTDAGTTGAIQMLILTDGTITFSKLNGTQFVNASGVCGPLTSVISYNLF